jgi:putative DNA primase/helicase
MRMRKKTFRQRRPDPGHSGSWIWDADGVSVLPYRLPALIAAVANEQMIVIVEGEGKADLLWSWNVPATCCAGGAKKWRAEHTEFLRGADVVILPDNDVVGRKHVDIVAASLTSQHRSVCSIFPACRRRIGPPPAGSILPCVIGWYGRPRM